MSALRAELLGGVALVRVLDAYAMQHRMRPWLPIRLDPQTHIVGTTTRHFQTVYSQPRERRRPFVVYGHPE